jgi:4-hydroxythreonine-4-phosphate dehydrogenase
MTIQSLPHLALTIGDPAGIGPEIILKALADPAIFQKCRVTVIGSRARLETTYQQLKKSHYYEAIDPQELTIVDLTADALEEGQIICGRGNAVSGAASYVYLQEAISRTLQGEFQGIVTAPIAKSLWKAAGYNYPGQTEVLAQKAGVEKFGMLFVARSPHTGWMLRTLLATVHISLALVSASLTPELMSLKLDLLEACLKLDFGLTSPTIVIAGLNPHSGEGGQLGTEEIDWLIPWLENEKNRRDNLHLLGPVPPDTMWVNPGRAWFGHGEPIEAADGYLALYHDQGLIPVKLMAFDEAINTTIGLPFIRTSPDHGTAFDIAGLGIAKAHSIKAAIFLAAQLSQSRQTNSRYLDFLDRTSFS